MVKSRLRLLIAQKGHAEGRSISYRQIEAATNVPASTISRLVSNQITRFEADTLSALCKYFSCSVGDILEYCPEESEAVTL